MAVQIVKLPRAKMNHLAIFLLFALSKLTLFKTVYARSTATNELSHSPVFKDILRRKSIDTQLLINNVR
jgi:hypothetical protein